MTVDIEAIDGFSNSVHEYTKYKFEELKNQLLNGGDHFNDGTNVKWMSNQTTWNTMRGVWNYNPSYDCQPCKELFDKVVALHTNTAKIGFENCKRKAVAGCWGIAKLFMPEGNEDVECLEDTDISTVLQMIPNSRQFNNLPNQDVYKIIRGLDPADGYLAKNRRELATLMTRFLQSMMRDDIEDGTIRENLKQAVTQIRKSQSTVEPPDLITPCPCTIARAIKRYFGFLTNNKNNRILLGQHIFAVLIYISLRRKE